MRTISRAIVQKGRFLYHINLQINVKRTKIEQKGIFMPPIDQHIPWSRSGYKEEDQGGLGKTGGMKA